MVFNVVARNQDDHTKNFSFLMDKGGKWRLSPAYDVAYSHKPGSHWVEQHNTSLNGKRSGFTRDDLLAVASQIGNFKERDANDIIEQCTEVVSRWRTMATERAYWQSHLRRPAPAELLYLSPASKEILGQPSEYFVEDVNRFWEMVHPNDLQQILSQDVHANEARAI